MTQNPWGYTARSSVERVLTGAWGYAFIRVKGGGIGFHGLTIGEFETQAWEEKKQAAQMVSYQNPPRSLKPRCLGGVRGPALHLVVVAMCSWEKVSLK